MPLNNKSIIPRMDMTETGSRYQRMVLFVVAIEGIFDAIE
jgi:hypothetical protein